MNELMPCPRCGGKAEMDDDTVVCYACGYWTGDIMNRDEAIEWWNTRPLEDALRARIAELEAKIEGLEVVIDYIINPPVVTFDGLRPAGEKEATDG